MKPFESIAFACIDFIEQTHCSLFRHLITAAQWFHPKFKIEYNLFLIRIASIESTIVPCPYSAHNSGVSIVLRSEFVSHNFSYLFTILLLRPRALRPPPYQSNSSKYTLRNPRAQTKQGERRKKEKKTLRSKILNRQFRFVQYVCQK